MRFQLHFLLVAGICCLHLCYGQPSSCAKRCKTVNDCSDGLVCMAKTCVDDPTASTAICPSSCKPSGSIVYNNETISVDQCLKGKEYLFYNCSPPVKQDNVAILYFIDLSSSTAKCDGKSYNNTELVASMSTGWFHNGSLCFGSLKITAAENGRSVIAKVVDECDSTAGCNEEYDYYGPCAPNSLGATPAVWEALGYNISLGTIPVTWSFPSHKRSKDVVTVAASVSGVTVFLVLMTLGLLTWRNRADKAESFNNGPQELKYRALSRATGNFSESSKLGEGGFGTVFKGMLSDGTLVAVKRGDRSRQGQKQFKAEVVSIGSIHHLNLVKLIGFCIKSPVCMLVYEFMPNGSLDQWIFKKDCFLGWSKRISIALDVARGLAYLHEGCRERVLHLDIKSQNILLDENMQAKISDFGLAKLVEREKSHVVTVMRGTAGYMAPEWLQSRVTDRTDVYSFGILLLELVCAKRAIEQVTGTESELRFLAQVAANMVSTRNVINLVDSRLLVEDFNLGECEKVIRIGLLCIQEDPVQRPSMGSVVKMLEGVLELPAWGNDIALPAFIFNDGTPGSISIPVDLAR